ncbi:hypothetical protein [Mycoplasmopsis columbina]|uniref:Uncharacterized protein n=1 Tax=Mycoplasmopsis columbina SF7 TaxID=1037410 RepID=F9UJM8_9BACT|nr:hypothetical protein [Mycoplasmopsis columbina]EGV00409.1 hypothetical protein MCSF7_00371 [Mycoplasmopsis columbina SF7]VEU76725.1 Uncharacterised protein [Mycoplasmopsis columbina]
MKKIIPSSKKGLTIGSIMFFVSIILLVLSSLGVHYLQPGFERLVAAYKLGIRDVEIIDILFAASIIGLILSIILIVPSIIVLTVYTSEPSQYDSKAIYVKSNRYKYTDIESISQQEYRGRNIDAILLVLSNGREIKISCSTESIQKILSEMNEYLIQSKNVNTVQ